MKKKIKWYERRFFYTKLSFLTILRYLQFLYNLENFAFFPKKSQKCSVFITEDASMNCIDHVYYSIVLILLFLNLKK